MYRWWDDNETSVSLDFVLKNKLAVIVSNRIWKKKFNTVIKEIPAQKSLLFICIDVTGKI